jgi:hypothetical protein
LTLVYVSFEHEASAQQSEKPRPIYRYLEAMMFVVAIITNLTGALYVVVNGAQLEQLSGAALINAFGTLPLTVQITVGMAVLMAFVVPLVAKVAGIRIAKMAFRRRASDFREQAWADVERSETYREVFGLLVRAMPPEQAKAQAAELVSAYFGVTVRSRTAAPSIRIRKPPAPALPDGGSPALPDGAATTRERVEQLFEANPSWYDLSISQAMQAVNDAGVKAGRTTVGDVLRGKRNA